MITNLDRAVSFLALLTVLATIATGIDALTVGLSSVSVKCVATVGCVKTAIVYALFSRRVHRSSEPRLTTGRLSMQRGRLFS